MKILFMPGQKAIMQSMWSASCEEKCRKYGFEMAFSPLDQSNDWKDLLPEADFALTSWGSPVFTADLVAKAPALRMVGHSGGSPRNIADKSVFETGVRITTANYLMSRSVAEWALLAILMGSRNVGAYTCFSGKSPMNWQQQFSMGNLRCQTVGIWGMGDTTRHLLKMLAPLKPGKVLVCSQHSTEEYLASYGATKASFEEVLQKSDLLLLLAASTAENFEKIGSAELKMMRDDAVLINCGRAWLTQENALIAELKSGRIRAIIDVFHKEPTVENYVLESLPNVILTPHNAGYPGREEFVPFLLDEFHRYLSGEPLVGEINSRRFQLMTEEHK